MRALFRHTLVLVTALGLWADAPSGMIGEPAEATGRCDATVSSAAALRRAVNRRAPGARICISGTIRLRSTIEPKDRQTLVGLRGRAKIRPVKGVDIAFDLDRVSGVRIRRLDIAGFRVRAIQCGRNAVIKRNRIHDNRRNGIGGGDCSGIRIVGNEIDHNGARKHLGYGSGGVKLAGDADGTTVIRNRVHHNIGNGLWWDEDARDAFASRNRIYRNTRKGINYEVSGGPAVFRNNVVRWNNRSGHNDSSGIHVTSSQHVTIVDNVLGHNRNGGILVQHAGGRGFDLEDILVQDNDLNGDRLACEDEDEPDIICER
jgi:hypothetical protein